MQVSITVNGEANHVDVESRTLLADLLRDNLGLTGTKVGCETGECGACTVLIDGVAVKSCMTLAVQADGRQVTTIEGVSSHGTLNVFQESLWEKHGVQCGFCTPGMVMSLLPLLTQHENPSEQEVRGWLRGHLCRCTGYHNVVLAVQEAAQHMQQEQAQTAPAAD